MAPIAVALRARPGRRRADAADQEDREADREQASFAVLVAELPQQRGEHRRAEQEAGENPSRPHGRGMEVALQLREGGQHHRLLQAVRERGENERSEHPLAAIGGYREALTDGSTGSLEEVLISLRDRAGRVAANGRSRFRVAGVTV
jgi:hypothetical protein